MISIEKRAGVLAAVFFLTQCLFAYQPERGFWAQRRRAARDQRGVVLASVPGNGAVGSLAAQFPAAESVTPSLSRVLGRSVPPTFLKDHGNLLSALSTGHGSIRKISLPLKKSDRSLVVVHIQDVHMNPQAQWNIRETIRGLLRSGRVDLVGLEGATNEIDLQPFVDFPSRPAVAASADYVLKQNKITGPVHAAMTAEGRLPRFVGVDDPVHYPANVQAYRDAEPLLDFERKRVDELIRKLDQEKEEICSLELRALDGVVRSFEDQQVPLGDYVLELAARARSVPADVKRFTQAVALERTLDFKQVERERAALIGLLTQRLNPDETKSLLAHSVAYRGGQMGYGTFYEHLHTLCGKKNVPLSRFPAMDAYVRYVMLTDGIDAERLYEELSQLEKSIYQSLAKTTREKAWAARCQEMRLMKKLVNFSMTPTDWKEYEPLFGRPELAPFEAFYKEAHIRDGSMANNLLKALETGRATTALLVTGGFHAEGIANRLTAQGVTVLSYVPKIDKVDTAQGTANLSVFSQEKTPLEKLFAGEKLFLGHNPAGGVTEAALLTETIQGVGIPSVADRSKFGGYLSRYYQGRRLTFGAHTQRPDGSWVADVTLYDGDKKNTFSVVYRNEGNGLTIQSFGLAEKEVRPPFGGMVEKFIGLHKKLAPLAGWVSIVTEFPLFLLIPWWTPANFLWFARRHQANRPESVSLLLGWMAIHSLPRRHQYERAALWEKIGTGMRLGLVQHPFWNGLGLFTLAANKSLGGDASSDGTDPIHPADPAHSGYQELKVLGSKRMEAVINGRLKVIARMIFIRRGKYLLLEKQEKGSPRTKLDIPGGAAAGEELGINILAGARREAFEELELFLGGNKIDKSRDLGLGKRGFRLYSIPGPKTNFTNRRPTHFRRVELGPQELQRIRTSSEHKGHLWLTLPEVLQRFEELNTGPKMAFYMEFLREAYGITGVRSLHSLTDSRRLKSMTDPVLIETDRGSFVWCPNGDVMQYTPDGFFVETAMDRVANKKSFLYGWENPIVFREMGGQPRSIPLVLWRLKNESRSVRPPEFSFPNGNGNGTSETRNRSRAQINYLASRVPPGVNALLSVRLLVKRGGNYVFLAGDGHKNECPGGVGVTPEKLIGLVENQLGLPEGAVGSTNMSFGSDPLITHQIGDGASFKFVQVNDGVLHLDSNGPIENKGVVVLDYNQLKQHYYDFTLSARMLIVKEIVKNEYGLQVSSIKPIRHYQEGGVSQISLTTDKGAFVFRKANTIVDDSKTAVPVLKKPDGSNGFYVNIGGTNFILTRPQSRSSFYEKVSTEFREQEASVQRGDWIPHFRGIAQGIKGSKIWPELLNAQKEIAAGNKTSEISLKPDHSPVTEWDYKLQLAFLDMIQQTGLPAYVVGEESPLSQTFLNTLPPQDQDRVIDLVFNNAANVPDGLVFFVDPIDGTRNFTGGGTEFAFTFGVLYNGKPLYAATYLPATDVLYEAVVKDRAIYKNGEPVGSGRAQAFSLLKVQRGLQSRWQKVPPAAFPNVDHRIPSIAVTVARMAAGENGAASELVLNPGGVFPWDFVPALIFLYAAGFKVLDFNGNSVLTELVRHVRKGAPPRHLVSQVLVAGPKSVRFLLDAVHEVLKQPIEQSVGPGRATSLWMTKMFELVGAWVDKFASQEIKDRHEKTFEERFGIHYKRNAPRYEWGFAAVALVANLVWVNSVWMGVGFSALFVISHFKFFNLKTDVKVGPFRVLVMAVIYGALIALSPDSVFGLIHGTGAQSAVNFFMTFVIWHVAYGIHRYFDPPWRTATNKIVPRVEISPLSLSYWGSRYFGLEEPRARLLGGIEMLAQIPLLVMLRLFADKSGSSYPGLYSLMGLDPILGPLFMIILVYTFWSNYVVMSIAANAEGDDPPRFGQLVAPLTVFLFLIPSHLGLGLGAFIYLVYFMMALVDKTPERKRILSAPETTKKNRTIRLLSALPADVESNSEDVLSVRILVKILDETLWGKRMKFLFVKNQDGRWEVPGGGGKKGETISNAALREIKEELGDNFMKALRRLSKNFTETPQFVHEIVTAKDNKWFRSVSVVQAEPKFVPKVRLNDESLAHRWMSLDQAKRMYMGFTLNTRMALLNPILESEYGVTGILNISPIEGVVSDVEGAPLRITTQDGGATRDFVLRHRDQWVAPPNGKSMIPLARKNTIFDRSEYLILTRQPMVLEEIGEPPKGERIENVNQASDGISTDLPSAPGSVAQNILNVLKGKSLRMGVGELRELIYETAEKNAASESGFEIDLGVPSGAGDGVKFYLVDPVTLEKPGNGDRLKNLLSKNPDLIVVLAQPVEGIAQDQVIVSPNSIEKNGVGYDVIVSGLRDSILKAAGDRPFQIMTSPLLSLNTTNMAEDDPVRQASENAVVYVLELLIGFFRQGV
jgi:fructose-1,6-bisphosphatase/inositol monophosphatase family enzyme/8-oxo-dGTP pyrophosphatase MutT (NUDIX family)